jgi:hypothetical protein
MALSLPRGRGAFPLAAKQPSLGLFVDHTVSHPRGT